jgi:hypothetical protein
MELSEAKEYLRKIRWYDVLIDSKLEELTMLECKATKITPTMNDIGGSGGGVHDKIGDAAAKIVDLREAINNDIDAFVNLKREAADLLKRVKNPDYYKILHKRYFGYKTFEQIAIETGYSYRNVLYIHGRALQAFQRALDKTK